MRKFIEIEDDVFDKIEIIAKASGVNSVDQYLSMIASGDASIKVSDSPSIEQISIAN